MISRISTDLTNRFDDLVKDTVEKLTKEFKEDVLERLRYAVKNLQENKSLSEKLEGNQDIYPVKRKPCVYLFLKGEQVVYVGSSECGLFRVFGKLSNRELNRSTAVKSADRVKVLWFDTIFEARRIETEIICKLNPLGNTNLSRKDNKIEWRVGL